MLVLPDINFLHLILPVALLVGGWMTPTPSQGPPIPQGGAGLMGYDHNHGRGGGGGDPEPWTYIQIAQSIHFFLCMYNTRWIYGKEAPSVVMSLLTFGRGEVRQLALNPSCCVTCIQSNVVTYSSDVTIGEDVRYPILYLLVSDQTNWYSWASLP